MSNSEPVITPELTVDQLGPDRVQPLDPSLLKLSDEEKEFLHAVITPDDEELPQKKHAELSLPAFLFPPELPFNPSKPHRGLMKSTLLLKVCCRWIDIYTRLT